MAAHRVPTPDLPLTLDPVGHLLTWSAGGFVLAIVLALAVAATANGTAARLDVEPRLVTVVLPSAAVGAPSEAEMAGIAAGLERLDGVAFARVLTPQELARLWAPWLASASGIPLPRLIDLAFNPGREPAWPALAAQVARLAPGATLEQRADDGTATREAARLLRSTALGAAAVLLALLMGVVNRLTRIGLALQRETVGMLRLWGAAEADIGRELARRVLTCVLRGGLCGFAAASSLALGPSLAPAAWPHGGLPALHLGPADWLLLGCVPIAAALLAVWAARWTARRHLAGSR